MAQARFVHGEPQMVDYTPGSALTAGDVIVVGDIPYVVHTDVAASKLCGVSSRGGVYECTASGSISAGARVYWDDTNNKVTINSLGNKHFGYAEPSASATNGQLIRVIHQPEGIDGDLRDVGTVAAAGSAQGDATALVNGVSYVSAADGTKGVVLPAAIAGRKAVVYNTHATNGLKIYPASGDDIDDGSADAAIVLEGKNSVLLIGLDTSTWAAIDYTANT